MMHRPHRNEPRSNNVSPPRHGMALLAAMVCLLVLSALSVSLVRTILARVRESTLYEHQLQADSLAQSAIRRGLAQRSAQADFRQEVWTPEVAGSPPLRAEIEWTEAPAGGTLRVLCTVPADSATPVRVERIIPVSQLTPSKGE